MSEDVGSTPNIFFHAVHVEALRADARFTALPPVEDVVLAGAPSYRFVRQASGFGCVFPGEDEIPEAARLDAG